MPKSHAGHKEARADHEERDSYATPEAARTKDAETKGQSLVAPPSHGDTRRPEARNLRQTASHRTSWFIAIVACLIIAAAAVALLMTFGGKQAHTFSAEQKAALDKASLKEIEVDPKILEIALTQGKAAFSSYCANCHGSDGRGKKGYPDLTTGRLLWGESLGQIQTTITHGIRALDDPDTHTSAMPAFGKDGILKPEEIREVANYVRTIAGKNSEPGVSIAAGKKIFIDNCAICHGEDGKGNVDTGSANLTAKVWQYGTDIKDLIETISNAHNSVMPAWGKQLDQSTIKALTLYTYTDLRQCPEPSF